MKNLILVFSFLFFSSAIFGYNKINSDLSNSNDELIVQEDDFLNPCEQLALNVELIVADILEEHPGGEDIASAVGVVVLNECCKLLPVACN